MGAGVAGRDARGRGGGEEDAARRAERVEAGLGAEGAGVGRACGAGVEVEDEERLLELGSARDELAVGVEGDALAVEDEFVLPAGHIDVGDEAAVAAGALGEHFAALFAASAMVGGCVDIDDDLRAGEALDGGGPGVAPDVFANVDGDLGAVDFVDGAFLAGSEVALFIEDAVVGEHRFAVDGGDAAVVEDGGGVVDAALRVAGVGSGAPGGRARRR